MKRSIIALAVAALSCVAANGTAGEAEIEQGKNLFTEMKCGGCHNSVVDQMEIGMGPSLVTIAETYAGNKEGLIAFMKHKEKPKVSPENFMVMELQLMTLLADKSDAELDAIAEYLITYEAPPAQETAVEGEGESDQ